MDRQEDSALLGDLETTTKDEIESTLGALRGVMSESLEWRAWVRRRPWPALLLAALVGYRIGHGRWL